MQTVSQINYYAYCLFQRLGEHSSILLGGNLLQQYIVDTGASSEQQHLNWMKFNQNALRAKVYTGIVNAFGNDSGDPKEIGQSIIFPATFQGGTRDMQTNLQKSLAVVREKGACDACITLTGNPDCDEVRAALLPGQTPVD